MSLSELIEQLEMIRADHPNATDLEMRVNELDVFGVDLKSDEDGQFVEIECFRPHALV